ncbi:MAG: large conductance mechanosensitive channel protein MscL [Chloroflexi bacterium HGW-Chloroflexi-3]|nr:MAG: large conductance mechanosensitive channel protein MscL [Chloroflexi bacterium HGW-Chloroflexi-3]
MRAQQFFKELKEFTAQGSIIDLAIGVILGAAFGKITTSLVNDILMPPIGLLLGEVNFSNLFINLSSHAYPTLKSAQDAGAPTINYGLFITSIVDFGIITLALFLLVKPFKKLRAKKNQNSVTQPCPYCYTQIDQRATRCPQCTMPVKFEQSK